jgi:hypothetical protein
MSRFCLFLMGILACSCQTSPLVNLVPDAASVTPSYWCTWGAQNYATDSVTLRNAVWGVNGHSSQADHLTESALFGEHGWAYFLPEVSKDLLIMFDVGWDVASGINFDDRRWLLGSLELAEDKFPSCNGTPTERLWKLNQLCKDHGWKGAGIWVAAHPAVQDPSGNMTRKAMEDYYRERMIWSRDAGITYWKVDYGSFSSKHWFRKMLSDLAREVAPDLLVENARNSAPVNDYECPWDTDMYHETGEYQEWGDGQVLETAVRMIGYSQVFRTYDVTAQLSVPTTLDRTAQQLALASTDGQNTCLLNTEDEMYLGAALGCALGIMRHPMWMTLEGNQYDIFNARKRITEVVRAVRWQRMAPAFPVGAASVHLDPVYLTDTWTFQKGDTWASWFDGRQIQQKAPARVSRGMDLPVVDCEGDPPYVVASRNPNGAVAIAALPRVFADRSLHHRQAEIRISRLQEEFPIGFFGTCRQLTLEFEALSGNQHLWAQDLALETALDISGRVRWDEHQIIIPGELIREIGTMGNGPDDHSEPGLVLMLNPN